MMDSFRLGRRNVCVREYGVEKKDRTYDIRENWRFGRKYFFEIQIEVQYHVSQCSIK